MSPLVVAVVTTWALAAPPTAPRLDLNTATVDQLAALPGIGPAKAAAIVAFREDRGRFSAVEDLDAVPGVGPPTLQVLASRVTVAEPADTPPRPLRVDVNIADVDELMHLPAVDAERAAHIVEYRRTHGAFATCDDLAAVPTIGPATVAVIGTACTVEQEQAR